MYHSESSRRLGMKMGLMNLQVYSSLFVFHPTTSSHYQFLPLHSTALLSCLLSLLSRGLQHPHPLQSSPCRPLPFAPLQWFSLYLWSPHCLGTTDPVCQQRRASEAWNNKTVRVGNPLCDKVWRYITSNTTWEAGSIRSTNTSRHSQVQSNITCELISLDIAWNDEYTHLSPTWIHNGAFPGQHEDGRGQGIQGGGWWPGGSQVAGLGQCVEVGGPVNASRCCSVDELAQRFLSLSS